MLENQEFSFPAGAAARPTGQSARPTPSRAADSSLLTGLTGLALSGCAVATLASYFGSLWWLFDRASHFGVYWLAGLVGGAVLLGMMKRLRTSLLAGALAALNLLAIAPLYRSPARATPSASETRTLRLIAANVLTGNRIYERVIECLRAADADFAFVMAVDQRWQAQLEQLADQYPHAEFAARSDNSDVARLSRWPLETCEIRSLAPAQTPAIAARAAIDGVA